MTTRKDSGATAEEGTVEAVDSDPQGGGRCVPSVNVVISIFEDLAAIRAAHDRAIGRNELPELCVRKLERRDEANEHLVIVDVLRPKGLVWGLRRHLNTTECSDWAADRLGADAAYLIGSRASIGRFSILNSPSEPYGLIILQNNTQMILCLYFIGHTASEGRLVTTAAGSRDH